MLDSEITAVRWSPDGKLLRGRRKEGPRDACSTGGAMKVELRDLTPAERKEVQQRFEALAGKRFAPSPKKPRHEVWWPKAPLDGRAFPEGILPAGRRRRLQRIRAPARISSTACAAASSTSPISARRSRISATPANSTPICASWIRTRLVSNPTCLLASTHRRVPDHRLADALLGDRRLARSHREVRETIRRRGRAAQHVHGLRRPDARRRRASKI